ncbi:LAMI_0E15764g1_1 [Lachancea mirantina]|uniref:LAMI_0E15764g1_1 n=1 Tax=Lachancea mirantina TaxID=1230905 RepID=A0A1G4JSS4_9SACH|nr:LAMI_0E15764g1_1 [Lachancea mirantina]
MHEILDKAYDKYVGGNIDQSSLKHGDLLCDPTLVEDYADVVKTFPQRRRDDEEHSVNSSVVFNPAAGAAGSPSKQYRMSHMSRVSGTSSTYSREDDAGASAAASATEAAECGSGATSTSDRARLLDEAYEYSDSEFEDNLETRLKDLESDFRKGETETAYFSDASVDASAEEDEKDLDITSGRIGLERDANDDDDDLDPDDDSDSNLLPLPPPEEIDPDKLYALYQFQGPDPSHCQLDQDQSCVLLNDQDSYWWLVKRCNDGKIGFAPAEILETFPERLARLNCWKNENMKPDEAASDTSTEDGDAKKGNLLQSYEKSNKSVSFNDVVSYAERYLEGSDNESTEHVAAGSPLDETYESRINDCGDTSEVVSDASFTVANIAPLQVKKTRPKGDSETAQSTQAETLKEAPVRESVASAKSTDDGLRQIFQAPAVPFASNNKGMPTSNSNYSISTIGEYSPSSSEWTNDSPQISNGGFDLEPTNDADAIPSTRAIQDISKIFAEPVKGPTSAQAVQVTQAASKHDVTAQRESISASSDDSCLDEERGTSATTINSTMSLPDGKHVHHPVVLELYSPLFSRIDDLMKKLDQFVAE